MFRSVFIKPVDKIKFRTYLNKWTSFKFILHSLFYEALLNLLASFSCSLQADSVDLCFSVAKLKALFPSLEKLKEDLPDATTELAKFVSSVDLEGQGVAEFRGVSLSAVQENVLHAFNNKRIEYVDRISSCLHNRFDDLQSSSVMQGVRILDVSSWPSGDSLTTYCDEEVAALIEHFRPLLENDVSLTSIASEWTALKEYWAATATLEGTKIWPLLLRCHRAQFSNLARLIEILLLLPVSNAKVERGFGTMRRIKTDWRSRLSEHTMDSLMRISVDGPPVHESCAATPVKRFFATPRRPHVLPYGPRKRTHAESEE